MKRLFFSFVIMAVSLVTWGNDGVFFVNGNHLVPVMESDIALTKEVLTICLQDDGYAKVDVQYTLTNRGGEKLVIMGFEASAPYNDDADFNPKGVHPYISDFTVEMNGKKLDYMNAVVKSEYGKDCDFWPLDLKKWKSYGEVKMRDGEDLPDNSMLYDREKDSLIDFGYAYYFKAHFAPGKNKVHHTYRYKMSYGVGRTFEVPYWLLPAMRWSNRQIDDFTLRIKTPGTAKHFYVCDSVFAQSPFVITKGVGKMKKVKNWNEQFTEIVLRNGTVEWHARNIRPVSNFTIESAERLNYDNFILGTFYDRSDMYNPSGYVLESDKSEETLRILKNLPYASRGYVFKDQKLQKYFSQFWWYMPDPAWKPDTSDFTPREWKLINKGE